MSDKLNIIEELSIKTEYYHLAKDLCQRIIEEETLTNKKSIIAIGGESGSGKSTTAYCLKKELAHIGVRSIILHMDSYFKLPPKDNHAQRTISLDHVGPQEVDIKKLNEHLSSFVMNTKEINVPIVSYEDNSFSTRSINLNIVDVIIIEGVYSFLLDKLDLKVFLRRNYKDTLENRIKRTRENHEPLIESILEIEHKIVRRMINDADYIIGTNYKLL